MYVTTFAVLDFKEQAFVQVQIITNLGASFSGASVESFVPHPSEWGC